MLPLPQLCKLLMPSAGMLAGDPRVEECLLVLPQVLLHRWIPMWDHMLQLWNHSGFNIMADHGTTKMAGLCCIMVRVQATGLVGLLAGIWGLTVNRLVDHGPLGLLLGFGFC